MRCAGARPLAVIISATDERGAGTIAAMVQLVDPALAYEAAVVPVCRHYGLSPVETRLTGYLVDGMCLSAAAEKMRVREQTARAYLKSIFIKTDTNRQGESIALMLRSCALPAPGNRALAA